MTIAKNAKPSKQKTAITVALAAGALAAAGTAAPGGETPTTATPKPDSSIAPASAVLAAIATPNSLYAAGGAAQVAVLGQGSGGIPAFGATPKVGQQARTCSRRSSSRTQLRRRPVPDRLGPPGRSRMRR
jgi:hypothetical protein